MSVHEELKSILKELIPCIKGKWFLSDGGLLGLIRDGDLIEWDNDLDLYFAEGTELDLELLSKTSLCYQTYYTCGKIFRKTNPLYKKNTFTEYISFLRTTTYRDISINRAKMSAIASKTYHDNKIPIQFTMPWIDIFGLKLSNDETRYLVPHWPKLYYTKFDLNTLIKNKTLGFPIYIPQNHKRILSMLYGDNYLVPNQDFQHV